tara:strand:- start:99 stop:335 length:237 start_codon:yes stop_codon:yes gene_type:complete
MSDKNNFIDESYATLKEITKEKEFSKEEMSDIDTFVKSLNKTIETITDKNKNLIVNFGKAFKYIIEEGVGKNDNKRNA